MEVNIKRYNWKHILQTEFRGGPICICGVSHPGGLLDKHQCDQMFLYVVYGGCAPPTHVACNKPARFMLVLRCPVLFLAMV